MTQKKLGGLENKDYNCISTFFLDLDKATLEEKSNAFERTYLSIFTQAFDYIHIPKRKLSAGMGRRDYEGLQLFPEQPQVSLFIFI